MWLSEDLHLGQYVPFLGPFLKQLEQSLRLSGLAALHDRQRDDLAGPLTKLAVCSVFLSSAWILVNSTTFFQMRSLVSGLFAVTGILSISFFNSG